jgi:hypothetical protein
VLTLDSLSRSLSQRLRTLKADTVGRTAIQSYADFKAKVKSSMHSLQRNARKIRSFFQDTLKYAA